MRVLRNLLVLVAALGCDPSLGECDPALAERVVFDVNGYPAYEAQAMVQVSCGNGQLCHASDVRPEERAGAPSGLSFDMTGSRTPNDRLLDIAAIERLESGRASLLAHGSSSLGQVQAGLMPPRVDGEVQIAAGQYPGLPRIDSDEGQAVFRNWLACGAPVVERTTEVRSGLSHRDPCEPGEVGACFVRDEVAPLEPTFDSIYARVLFPLCGNSCHAPAFQTVFSQHDLDLSERNAAYDALMANTPCGDRPRVVPGDPDTSYLILKLSEGADICGERMPTSGGSAYLDEATMDVVRAWIAAGAPRGS